MDFLSGRHVLPARAARALACVSVVLCTCTRPVASDAQGLPPSAAIGCTLRVRPPATDELVLVNTSLEALAAGTRFVWTSTGTPQPSGAVQVLPVVLSPGQTVAVAAGRATHGAGCLARVVVDGGRLATGPSP